MAIDPKKIAEWALHAAPGGPDIPDLRSDLYLEAVPALIDEVERLRSAIAAELRDGAAVFTGCGRPECEPCGIRRRLDALLSGVER